MSADSIYSDDWNSSLPESQINTWNLEDDINRIGSKAEDFLSGIWGAESSPSDINSRRKTHFNQDSSNPFRQFQTPPPGRTSPTPLADLYSQSIYRAEVDSDSWQPSENNNRLDNTFEPSDEVDRISAENLKDVQCMPQDLFSFSQQLSDLSDHTEAGATESKNALPESVKRLNRLLTKSDDSSSAESDALSLTEEYSDSNAPQLLVNTTKDGAGRPARNPLLSLSIGMSICGVGLVFGAQIMHNSSVVNPGKSLIIAGLIGLFVSVVFQAVNKFGKRRTTV